MNIRWRSLQENKELLKGGWLTEEGMAQLPGWNEYRPQCILSCLLSSRNTTFRLKIVGHHFWEIPFTTTTFDQMNPNLVHGFLVAPVLRTMVKNAVEWAKKKGLSRINAVHGAEEYRVPTEESFEHSEIDRTRTTASASVQLEAGPQCVLQ